MSTIRTSLGYGENGAGSGAAHSIVQPTIGLIYSASGKPRADKVRVI
jgi:hypothetical protein